MAACAPKGTGRAGGLEAQVTARPRGADAIRACDSDRLCPHRVARPSKAHPVAAGFAHCMDALGAPGWLKMPDCSVSKGARWNGPPLGSEGPLIRCALRCHLISEPRIAQTDPVGPYPGSAARTPRSRLNGEERLGPQSLTRSLVARPRRMMAVPQQAPLVST